MPYRWTETEDHSTLSLWPHQSMTADGFVWFIAPTAILFTLPLFAVLGSTVAWVLMASFATALWAIWKAIMVNRKHRSLTEVLTISGETLLLEHRPADGAKKEFQANPYWVRVGLRDDGPVENYLTISGDGREVELGSCLTPDERLQLHRELQRRLFA